MKSLIALVFGIFSSISILAQDNADKVIGLWLNGEGTGQIQIYKTTSGHFAGKIIWLKEPIDPETGQPKFDKRNPDKSKRNIPTLGLVNMRNFKYNSEDKIWEHGRIYDPKNGKEYSCKMELSNENTLKVRGYMGISLLGRTDTWTRIVKK
jgi:uncharacterized protein (DUF2147 family)